MTIASRLIDATSAKGADPFTFLTLDMIQSDQRLAFELQQYLFLERVERLPFRKASIDSR
ncbi:hypothetical protein PHMEG_00013027 [Phytophthora megakarya]|uniref:Uncharacterized protein n=1 Tax=Phytophthora megakarya TaxID=4795 RepID=A0A225W794_9STRA|nr:hypothetical protein PHMEG_00013027 [Phytophthora megakarya]